MSLNYSRHSTNYVHITAINPIMVTPHQAKRYLTIFKSYYSKLVFNLLLTMCIKCFLDTIDAVVLPQER